MAIWIHLTVIFPLVSVVFMLEPNLKSYKKLEVCLFPFPHCSTRHGLLLPFCQIGEIISRFKLHNDSLSEQHKH